MKKVILLMACAIGLISGTASAQTLPGVPQSRVDSLLDSWLHIVDFRQSMQQVVDEDGPNLRVCRNFKVFFEDLHYTDSLLDEYSKQQKMILDSSLSMYSFEQLDSHSYKIGAGPCEYTVLLRVTDLKLQLETAKFMLTMLDYIEGNLDEPSFLEKRSQWRYKFNTATNYWQPAFEFLETVYPTEK